MRTERQFLANRRMFYLIGVDKPNGLKMIEPDDEYKNWTCADWFDKIGVDINKVIRGYYIYGDACVMLYIGDYKQPDLDVIEMYRIVSMVLTRFNRRIAWVGFGAHKGVPGEVWRPYLKVIK